MSQDRLLKVLLAPHISEKATVLAERHKQFVFRVAPDATKPLVKQAVELMFDVKVDGVRIVNVKGKSKRRGSKYGRRPGVKKAYVALQPGYDIEFMGPQ